MKSIRLYLNKYIFSSKERTIALFVLLLLAITIPLTLNLLEQEQDLKKGAAFTNGADITISASTPTVTAGDEFTVNVQMTSNTYEITAAEMHLEFPKDTFKFVSFTKGDFLTLELLSPFETPTGISFVYASTLGAPKKGTGSIGTLRLQALKATQGSPITVGTSTFVTAKDIGVKDPNGQLTESYNVVNTTNNASVKVNASTLPTNTPGNPTPTLTPAPTLIPTSTPTGIPTPTVTITPTPTPTLTPRPTLTPTPTVTPIPTATPDPNTAHLELTIELPGIGLKEKTGVAHPKRTARDLTVMLINADNQEVRTTTEAISYDGNMYKGTINVAGNIIPGPYTVKIRMDNTLWKLIPGIYNLKPQTTVKPTAQTLITGDIDGNNVMELADYNILAGCYKKTTCEEKYKALSDLNDDGITDSIDYNIMLRNFATRNGD